MDLKKLYINGQWVAPLSGQYIEVENPADKSVFATVAAAGADDVAAAAKRGRCFPGLVGYAAGRPHHVYEKFAGPDD